LFVQAGALLWARSRASLGINFNESGTAFAYQRRFTCIQGVPEPSRLAFNCVPSDHFKAAGFPVNGNRDRDQRTDNRTAEARIRIYFRWERSGSNSFVVLLWRCDADLIVAIFDSRETEKPETPVNDSLALFLSLLSLSKRHEQACTRQTDSNRNRDRHLASTDLHCVQTLTLALSARNADNLQPHIEKRCFRR